MKSGPLVSVICLCYNHGRFVTEAITSVMNQTYENIQLIVVDDASVDDSVSRINQIRQNYPTIEFLELPVNQGNCRAFNRGYASAKGEFIIDLAADDVLLPSRVEEGVKLFSSLSGDYGVQFSDAELIRENGDHIGFHSDKHPHSTIPQGDVYKDVVGRFFINSPTMMIRRKVMEALGGYDETLAYEDFDFWVRSARTFKYCYYPGALIRRRIVGTSMTRLQYKRNSPQLQSTYIVCVKIALLNQSPSEDDALSKRIWYEARKAFAVGEMRLVVRYAKLWWKI